MIEEDYFDLLNDFSTLAIDAPAPRQSGFITTQPMPWNSQDCKVGLEYKNIYTSRMEKLKKRYNIPGITPIAEVRDNYSRYCISGILKRLQLKRVRAFQKDYSKTYMSSENIYNILDELEIEDETGKLKLSLVDCMIGNRTLIKTDLPYGVHVVLQGKFKKKSNKFSANKIFLPMLDRQQNFVMNYVNKQGVDLKDKKMLVLSQPSIDQCQYVYDLLCKSYSQEVRSISAIVIIGGLELKIESIAQMSTVVKRLKDIIDVFIMPSSTKDRRKLFPLQQYNGNFFSQSKGNIGLCSNPQMFEIENGMKIHITCGENVIDFKKNCSLAKDQVDILESFIHFSHFCPTSPFSLKTEPYLEDYLVMEEIPHIMITGKGQQFKAKKVVVNNREILLVSIAEGGMGLVSLNQLQAYSFN